MYNSLLIGCGNIGAMYDFKTNDVITHAKAYTNDSRFSLTVFDMNDEISKNVSAKYGCKIETEISEDVLKNYDCVSICTPTDTHFEILKKCLEAKVKLIICEKPVSNKLEELKSLIKSYETSDSKVMVNYLRRFQPAFIELRTFITNLLTKEKLTNINVRYQRGYINNCSHAFDLIEYLTDSEINTEKIIETNRTYDHFTNDPTLSYGTKWNICELMVEGLSNVKFSHFEIDLYFEYHKIKISEGGQTIEIFKTEEAETFYKPLLIQDQLTRNFCVKNYMINVMNHAINILENREKDNFISSIELNKRMLLNI